MITPKNVSADRPRVPFWPFGAAAPQPLEAYSYCPTPFFSSISLLEIGRKDERCLLREDRFERRPLTGSAIKMRQGSFPRASWPCVEIRERERVGGLKKRGKERVGERLDRDFKKQGLERGGRKRF